MRAGGFQVGIPSGTLLEGSTLGVVGVGRIGARVARLGSALGMRVLAWSQNLTADKAAAVGAKLVDKSTLFAEADAITLHLFLSERTRNIVGAREFEQMKPGAILVNTARAGLVDETALLQRLQQGALTAALDVYWQEPLAADERALRRRRRAYDGFQLPLHSRIPHTRRSRRCASCLIDRVPVARRRCLLHAAARKAMRLSEKPGFAVARM